MTRISLALLLSAFLGTACTTAPKTTEPVDEPIADDSRGVRVKRLPPLDLAKVSQQLGTERSLEDVGYQEKAFNDCALPEGYRLSDSCSTQYLSVIHFRMRCRDSEGTVESVSSGELSPLVSRSIKWNLAGQNGGTSTNAKGYGIVRALTPSSTRGKSFRLTVNQQIMSVEVGEVRQFVLPNYWCR
jgi:hypothetical protein